MSLIVYSDQIRLSPLQAGELTVYRLPNQGTPNLNSTQLSLSGYDLPNFSKLQFRVQLSYDDDSESFQILLRMFNSTRFYNLNFFILSLTQKASAFLSLHSIMFAFTMVDLFSRNVIGLNQVQLFDSTFRQNSTNKVLLIPVLKSIQTVSEGQFAYFNISLLQIRMNSTYFTLALNNTNGYLIEAFMVIIGCIQDSLQIKQNSAYEYSTLTVTMDSDNPSITLSSLSKTNFNIHFKYGPILEPKCLIGIQKYQVSVNQKATLSFNFSRPGVTQLGVSLKYSYQYAYFCFADIKCSAQNLQYYPLLGDCQPSCTINNCSRCSSSTSCVQCSPGFFVDSLFRCSPCRHRCLKCPNQIFCQDCEIGYYAKDGSCIVCPLYCLRCTADICLSCQNGYTPQMNSCMSCETAMPNCIFCSSSITCTLCRQRFIYNSNVRGCSSCMSLMDNCQFCDTTNNCVRCVAGFFRRSFNTCQRCRHDVRQCCSTYVRNCFSCISNNTCQVCDVGYFLTRNATCSLCQPFFGSNCQTCNSERCLMCFQGYFMSANQCSLCNESITYCQKCTNSTFCSKCVQPYRFLSNRCLNCPIWPLNNLYFIDSSNKCQPCSVVVYNCRLCENEHVCLQCQSIYYLDDNKCRLCSQKIANCLTCRNDVCRQCQDGFYLSSSQTTCLSCQDIIKNCQSCSAITDIKTQISAVRCSSCFPQYIITNGQCAICQYLFPHCLLCNNAGCLQCKFSYFVNSLNKCVTCQQTIQGCTQCLTANQCLNCAQGYFLFGEFCTSCSVQIKNCHSCQSDNVHNISCLTCMDGFFMDSTRTCKQCSQVFRFCHACLPNKCINCIPGYYIAPNGFCDHCSRLVSNCEYCSSQLKCLSCQKNYIFNRESGSCDACSILVSGCALCTPVSTGGINCTECLPSYLAYLNSQSMTSCIACNVSMPHCSNCSNLTQCQSCQSIAFLNPVQTCSLCSQFLPNCLQCITSQRCEKCHQNFGLNTKGLCLKCTLQQFGRTPFPLSRALCSQCLVGDVAFCASCVQGYYVSQNKAQCLSCQNHILNCFSCLVPTLCVQCNSGFFLSSDNRACIPCQMKNCGKCTQNGQCIQCDKHSYFSSSICQSCSFLVLGCNTCKQETCLSCLDGFFFDQFSCVSCQKISPNCVLCTRQECLLVNSPPPAPPGNHLFYVAVSIIGLISSIGILIGLLIWRICWPSSSNNQLQESVVIGGETHRKIQKDQFCSHQVNLEKGKLCQLCQNEVPQVILFQLLCSQCEKIKKRGESHKIRKLLNQENEPQKQNISAQEAIHQQMPRTQIETRNQHKQTRLQIDSMITKKNNSTNAETKVVRSQAYRSMF